ncbi:MAG: hypothetical protein ABF649_03705 [Bacillus sp. (in: firmicutes)]
MNQKLRLAINLYLVLISYFLCVAGYKIYEGVAQMKKGGQMEFVMQLPAIPSIITIVGLVLMPLIYVLYCKKRGMKVFSNKALFYPIEFDEQDEREKMINAKACRASYIAVQYSIAIGAVLLILLYPFIKEQFTTFPLLVLFLILFIQHMVHFLTFQKHA